MSVKRFVGMVGLVPRRRTRMSIRTMDEYWTDRLAEFRAGMIAVGSEHRMVPLTQINDAYLRAVTMRSIGRAQSGRNAGAAQSAMGEIAMICAAEWLRRHRHDRETHLNVLIDDFFDAKCSVRDCLNVARVRVTHLRYCGIHANRAKLLQRCVHAAVQRREERQRSARERRSKIFEDQRWSHRKLRAVKRPHR